MFTWLQLSAHDYSLPLQLAVLNIKARKVLLKQEVFLPFAPSSPTLSWALCGLMLSFLHN